MSFSPNFRGQSASSSRQLQSNYQNGNSGTMAKGLMVSSNAIGQMLPIDLSDESSVMAMLGILSVNTPDAATGTVVSGGRIENFPTAFAVGDALYVDKNGLLTNVKPEVGQAGFATGDFVVFAGVIVKNEFNSLLKDVQLMIAVVGQL